MKKDNVYVRENSVFFRQSCAICGEMERPYSLMFVNEQEQFVCEYHIIDNEVNLILTQDDIHRLDTLVFLGNQEPPEMGAFLYTSIETDTRTRARANYVNNFILLIIK
jgi:hypothetical protein